MGDYMYSIIISAEITCAVFMVITLAGILVSSQKKDESTKFLILALLILLVSLPTDSASYLIEGYENNDGLLKFVALSTYILPNLSLIAFTYYMCALVRKHENISYSRAHVVSIFCIADIILILVKFAQGSLFVVQNHRYIEGSAHSTVIILPIFCLLYLFILVVFHRKSMDLKTVISISSYVIFPLIGLAIPMIFKLAGEFVLVAASFSYGLIYVVVQMNTITDINIREKLLLEVSNKDYLTLLLNRRGYEKALEKLIDVSEIGVFFCDINGLKYTNDNFGHEAGDNLLKNFANILREVFDRGDICRISGDEFVVLLGGLTEEEIGDYAKKLRYAINKNSRIAAFGYTYGKKRMVLELVNEAEQHMYRDKEEYYKTR
ncbi:MAG: GGDEF domain-containing protein [Clostridia bacterium]|nr:GGDEF domain-containing protein [Clostridia bacterium]